MNMWWNSSKEKIGSKIHRKFDGHIWCEIPPPQKKNQIGTVFSGDIVWYNGIFAVIIRDAPNKPDIQILFGGEWLDSKR